MSPAELESAIYLIVECLSRGNLHDATQSMGTLLELVSEYPELRNEIGCRFERVFNNWSSLGE